MFDCTQRSEVRITTRESMAPCPLQREDPAATDVGAEAIAREAIEHLLGPRVDETPNQEIRPATLIEPTSPLVQGMLAANRNLGFLVELAEFCIATDGPFLAEADYQTIIYGPGDPSPAHIRNEWVGVDEVLDTTVAYALGALALLRSSS